MCIYIYIYTHTLSCIYIYIYAHTYIYIYIHIFICCKLISAPSPAPGGSACRLPSATHTNNYKHNCLYLALQAGGLSDIKLQELILTLRNRHIHNGSACRLPSATSPYSCMYSQLNLLFIIQIYCWVTILIIIFIIIRLIDIIYHLSIMPLRPVHLLRISLLRVLESNFPGDSL